MSIFEGAATALVTPFTETGIDFKGLQELIDFQLENEIDALVISGTTGEPATMTESEKAEVIRLAIRHVNGRVPVIVGTGANSTASAVKWSKFAEDEGADALLLVTPYYNKCSQDGLVRHYFTVADSVHIPMVLYNVPSRTGVNVTPATLARLAEHPNIAAMKEASANISQITEMVRLCDDKLDFYSGNDDHIIPIMSLGGKGVISVLSNVVPQYTHELCAAYLAGDTRRALQMQLDINPLVSALFSDVNPIPVKTALNLMGKPAGPLRLPLCEMSPEKTAALTAVLEDYNLI